MKTPKPVGQQGRWLDLLGEYDITTQHRPGRVHGNSDALSRRPCKRDVGMDCRQCSKATPTPVSKVKVKVRSIAVCNQPTPLREVTCHMGSHSVTCHPAEVTFPPLPRLIKAGTQPLFHVTRCRQKAQARCQPRYAFPSVTRNQLGPQTCYYTRATQTLLPAPWTRPSSWLRHRPRLTHPHLMTSRRRLTCSACPMSRLLCL